MPKFTISVTVRHHDCNRTTSGDLTNPTIHSVTDAIERFITLFKLRERHPVDDDDVDAPVITLVTAFRVDGAA